MPVDLLIVAVIFAVASLCCLGWMMWNLFSVMRREKLSIQLEKRTLQTREILLKPALTFFGVGGLCSVYFMVRNAWFAP